MAKDGHHNGKQKWQCRMNERARQKALSADPLFVEMKCRKERERYLNGGSDKHRVLYHERKARGVCTNCEAPLLSEALCWGCLNLQEEYRARKI